MVLQGKPLGLVQAFVQELTQPRGGGARVHEKTSSTHRKARRASGAGGWGGGWKSLEELTPLTPNPSPPRGEGSIRLGAYTFPCSKRRTSSWSIFFTLLRATHTVPTLRPNAS